MGNQKQQQHSPKPQEDKLLKQPRKSILLEALLNAGELESPIVQKYLKEYEEYQKGYIEHLNSLPKKEKEVLPDLQPINPESLYELFIKVFEIVHGKPFVESYNDFGSRKLARTLLSYFIGSNNFYKSPLLNHKSEPSLKKGFAIFGDFGVGKSAILEAFHILFKTAENNRFIVKDKFGTDQLLGRYKLSFEFNTSNAVVQEYEAINRSNKESEKEYKLNLFNKRHHYGYRNYDDIMSERTASNYGKLELFKEIFEERYSNKAKTLISLNYHENSLEKTLEVYAEKYGERLYDRFFEMFNIIELRGNSLRK